VRRRSTARGASPAERIEYGSDPDQYGEWRLPDSGETPLTVGVLVHGGYYRSKYRADLMDALALDLARRGWASWNLEYRRPDRHGWAATVDDLRAGIAALERVPHALDAPLVLFGHSAGGQLVLQVAEWMPANLPAVPVALAVSLAGVVDLVAAYELDLSNGAVRGALGGTPQEVADRYRDASPASFTGRRVPWLLVQGREDDPALIDMNRRLAVADAVDRPELIDAPGDHFSVIDPSSPIWNTTMDRVGRILGQRTR
jgi:acetyl esterase/lipase